MLTAALGRFPRLLSRLLPGALLMGLSGPAFAQADRGEDALPSVNYPSRPPASLREEIRPMRALDDARIAFPGQTPPPYHEANGGVFNCAAPPVIVTSPMFYGAAHPHRKVLARPGLLVGDGPGVRARHNAGHLPNLAPRFTVSQVPLRAPVSRSGRSAR